MPTIARRLGRRRNWSSPLRILSIGTNSLTFGILECRCRVDGVIVSGFMMTMTKSQWSMFYWWSWKLLANIFLYWKVLSNVLAVVPWVIDFIVDSGWAQEIVRSRSPLLVTTITSIITTSVKFIGFIISKRVITHSYVVASAVSKIGGGKNRKWTFSLHFCIKGCSQ